MVVYVSSYVTGGSQMKWSLMDIAISTIQSEYSHKLEAIYSVSMICEKDM